MKHCQIFILSLIIEESKCNNEPCDSGTELASITYTWQRPGQRVTVGQPASTSLSANISRRSELSADTKDHEIMAGLQ
jgi:hypothetical protein